MAFHRTGYGPNTKLTLGSNSHHGKCLSSVLRRWPLSEISALASVPQSLAQHLPTTRPDGENLPVSVTCVRHSTASPGASTHRDRGQLQPQNHGSGKLRVAINSTEPLDNVHPRVDVCVTDVSVALLQLPIRYRRASYFIITWRKQDRVDSAARSSCGLPSCQTSSEHSIAIWTPSVGSGVSGKSGGRSSSPVSAKHGNGVKLWRHGVANRGQTVAVCL